ncbi:MAG: hypothetical protein J5979_00710 [Lachnospiraceae bacterium]|nr:hypothetical protein [Lachnospiraceae bacterium]
MDVFNIFAGTCSIVGLFLSLFVASKVTKLSKSNNNNSGVLQTGDGKQSVASGASVIAGKGAVVNYTQEIHGKRDEPPVLTELEYEIIPVDYLQYEKGISRKACDLINMGESNNFRINVDFRTFQPVIKDKCWIGYAITSLPLKDWRSFVNKEYIFQFNYAALGEVANIWIELTNKKTNQKLYNRKLDLSSDEQRFQLCLGNYNNAIEDWQSIDEICFVFFPHECEKANGAVLISNMCIVKED